MQAARLASRLQRELRMLQTDPPPGVCAWPCSDQLTLLEAQIQGPEGTVYSKGIFKLEVQVPERYPFEPPNLRFVTPIYHPNIDNGGRICLDILNLPPKGAWRPSLNLATVLASIGLLLAEPNADDGLMGDITAEFKHNRSSFDLKAINLTKQYATQEQAVPKTLVNSDSLQVHSSMPSISEWSYKKHLQFKEENQKAAQCTTNNERCTSVSLGDRLMLSKSGLSFSKKLTLDRKTDALQGQNHEIPVYDNVRVGISQKVNLDKDNHEIPVSDNMKAVMSQKTNLDKDNFSSMLAEMHQKTDSNNKTSIQIVMAEIDSKSYKNKENLFPVKDVNMSNSKPLPVDVSKSSWPDRKTSCGDGKLCERGKLRLRREVSDQPYINSFFVNEQDDGIKDLQSSLLSRSKSFKVPKTKEGVQASVAESMHHFKAEKYCKHADVNNQLSVAISEAQYGTAVVIVSDSESDDELTERQSRLSLTQRSLIGKRKVSSKLR